MQLSLIGAIADEAWYWIPLHQPNVTLHTHVVMPDHVHLLFSLHAPGSYGEAPVVARTCLATTGAGGKSGKKEETDGCGRCVGGKARPYPLRTNDNRRIRHQNPGKHTVSSIVGGYKSIITTKARQQGYVFAWQKSFYDRIVRSDEEFFNVMRYIQQNPARWKGA
jgi:putative transposase